MRLAPAAGRRDLSVPVELHVVEHEHALGIEARLVWPPDDDRAVETALELAKFASQVTILVRRDSLAASMSDYLIREIATSARIEVRLRTRLVDGRGEDRLEGVVVEDEARRREEIPAAAIFVLIGAEPRTEWLGEALQRDRAGYIATGPDVSVERWPLERRPMLLETSCPGVFAVGDVRQGAVKRVAAAVGEGSVAIGSVHQYLTEVTARPAGP